MKINLRAAVPVSAVVLLLAACGGGSDSTGAAASTTAPSAAPSVAAPSTTAAQTPAADESTAAAAPSGAAKPKGFTLVVDKKNGYQLAIPSGFRRISKKSDLDKVVKAGNKALSSKGFVSLLDNKAFKLLAVNPNTGDAVNVVVSGAGGVTPDQMPQMKQVLTQQVKQIGATDIKIKASTLGGEPANRLSYQLKLQGRSLKTIQYVAVHDDSVYTLTLSEPVTISTKVENQTVDSWRFS